MVRKNRHEVVIIFLSITTLLLLLVPTASLESASILDATPTPNLSHDVPFLIPPFYGDLFLRSWFDHGLPNYSKDGQIIRFDGRKLADYNSEICEGGKNCYDGHNGLDFDAPVGEQVLAAADGIVTYAGWDRPDEHYEDYGLHITIEHNVYGNLYRTRYAHLGSLAVSVGEKVEAGKIIGTVSSNGGSSGPHLHFDVGIYTNEETGEDKFRSIDPFGYQPKGWIDDRGVYYEIKQDPWAVAALGARSWQWCMWKAGTFEDLCPNNSLGKPNYPLITKGPPIIIEDSDNSSKFKKGFSGPFIYPCNGVDTSNPSCRQWYQVTHTAIALDKHTFFTLADGHFGDNKTEDNWAKWQDPSLSLGLYEIYIYASDTGHPKDTFTWNANYQVKDCSGKKNSGRLIDYYVIDPKKDNPYKKWISIGMYCMDSNSYVYITDITGEPKGIHCKDQNPENPLDNNGWCRIPIDAIKMVRRERTYHFPIISFHPSPTPTATLKPMPTATSNPQFGICEPNENVNNWISNYNNKTKYPNYGTDCSLNTVSKSFYLYNKDRVTEDADVFRFSYKTTDPSVWVTIWLENIPTLPDGINKYPYKFEIYNANGEWSDISYQIESLANGNSYYAFPAAQNINYTFYIRVYSETWRYPDDYSNQFSANNMYSVRYAVSSGSYSPPSGAYPAP